MVAVRTTIIALIRSPLDDASYAYQRFVGHHPPALGRAALGLFGAWAQWIAQFLHHEPTPQQLATFAQELSALRREVGRRLVAWGVHHVEPDCPDETLELFLNKKEPSSTAQHRYQ